MTKNGLFRKYFRRCALGRRCNETYRDKRAGHSCKRSSNSRAAARAATHEDNRTRQQEETNRGAMALIPHKAMIPSLRGPAAHRQWVQVIFIRARVAQRRARRGRNSPLLAPDRIRLSTVGRPAADHRLWPVQSCPWVSGGGGGRIVLWTKRWVRGFRPFAPQH